ncbi:chromate transporter [Sediminispirochaeta smaragdinae]|uniref:Chromate transporter n=1 Tax=Sediminispirochaeta smaragdinae (strain DSM 11293 / JCM 15392 / SEBR 4228) TaxID=573413 RepID=E1R410_SEDSS|nr:chromate transporter [Sediminispirochaeta smaragdinae]ADK80432.1 Chromate transporter [Sediminispirochaeta smaragdinae DSM 11293]
MGQPSLKGPGNDQPSRRALSMFFTFFRIGAFTIGGGYAMLPLIEREIVHRQGWVSEEEIVDVFTIVQSVPGTIGINSAIFIGYRLAGFRGAVAAALGMILPSFIIISVLATLLVRFRDVPEVQRAFAGVRAGVTALIFIAALKLGKKVIQGIFPIVVALAAFLALVVFNLHAIAIIASAGLAGVLHYYFLRKEL